MPLHIQFLRDDEPRQMPNGFGGWHMLVALAQGAREYARLQHRRLPSTERLISGDPSEEKYEATLGWKAFGSTDVTVTEHIAYSDPKDGEVLKFIPGDKIRMWR